MNKFLFILITFLAFHPCTFGQPTIASQDGIEVGDTFNYYICGALAAGDSGSNVAWDFSGAASSGAYGVKYDTCHGIICDTFPMTNTVCKIPALNEEDFLVIDNSRSAHIGYVINSVNYIFSAPLDDIQYPIHYGDYFTQIFTAHFTKGGTPYVEQGSVTVKADAWGTLTLPTGVFPNVMRLHEVKTYTDSAVGGGPVTRDSIVIYTWLSPSHQEFLFKTRTSYQNGSFYSDTSIYTNQAGVTKVQGVNAVLNNVSVYPNPVKDELHLGFYMSKEDAVRISLHDMVGREIVMITSANFGVGQQLVNYNMPLLAPGIYILNMETSMGATTRQIAVW